MGLVLSQACVNGTDFGSAQSDTLSVLSVAETYFANLPKLEDWHDTGAPGTKSRQKECSRRYLKVP